VRSKAVGQFSAHKIDEKELIEVERRACRARDRAAACTPPNDVVGDRGAGHEPAFSSTMAAEDAEKADSAAKSAEAVVNAVHHQLLRVRS